MIKNSTNYLFDIWVHKLFAFKNSFSKKSKNGMNRIRIEYLLLINKRNLLVFIQGIFFIWQRAKVVFHWSFKFYPRIRIPFFIFFIWQRSNNVAFHCSFRYFSFSYYTKRISSFAKRIKHPLLLFRTLLPFLLFRPLLC